MTTLTTATDVSALEAKIDSLTEQVAILTQHAQLQARQRGAIQELTGDLAPISEEAFAKAVQVAAQLEEAGYFEFAKAGAGVVDRVVTSFSADDVEQLGDNVVTMITMLKDLTQPEMLVIYRSMLDGLDRERRAVSAEPVEPPSLRSLVRRLREPDVRRGLGRALDTLGAVSASTTAALESSDQNTHDEKGGR